MKKEIVLFQEEMKKRGVSMCLVPTGDSHLSEYVGDHFKIRAYLTGFTGSAGTLLVTLKEALLWTDGRYFVQGEQQLQGSGIRLMKAGEQNIPTVEEYVESQLKAGEILAFDGSLISVKQGRELARIADALGGEIRDMQWADSLWTNRPGLSFSPIRRLGLYYTGRRVQEKLELLRKDMIKCGADCHVLSSLDDIAWLFNLRGNDIPCNPVFLSYSIITTEEAVLFLDCTAVDKDLKETLRLENITLLPYVDFYGYLEKQIKDSKVLADPDRVNYRICHILLENNTIVEKENPTELHKAVKTTVEIDNIKDAQESDGLCMCRFLFWIKARVKEETPVTEWEAARYLDELRLGINDCEDLSFETIAAYGSNAAMCHYTPKEDAPVVLKPCGFLLVDSGGQYLKGTTDITRTISLGELTHEEKTYYTLVLKGHIRLGAARFPKGVCGANLDVLARGPLWGRGLDYGHGTGHGVGYYLNVHERPNSINWNLRQNLKNARPLLPGMLTSNEPGFYLENCLGIRLENLILTVPVKEAGMENFLGFETVTIVPFDREAILPELLEAWEKDWIDAYHRRAFELYDKRLNPMERLWLREATKPL